MAKTSKKVEADIAGLKATLDKHSEDKAGKIYQAARNLREHLVSTVEYAKLSPADKKQANAARTVGLDTVKNGLHATTIIIEKIAEQVLQNQIQGQLSGGCVKVAQTDHPVKFLVGVVSVNNQPMDDPPDGFAHACYMVSNNTYTPDYVQAGTAINCNKDKLQMKYTKFIMGSGVRSKLVFTHGQKSYVPYGGLNPAEAAYKKGFSSRWMYAGDVITAVIERDSGLTMSVSPEFSKARARIYNTNGFYDDAGNAVAATPAQNYQYNGWRYGEGDSRFGSAVVHMPEGNNGHGQFLGRTFTVTMVATNESLPNQLSDPCPDDHTITLDGLCEPEDLCSPIVSFNANKYGIVLSSLGDSATVTCVLGPDGKICWELTAYQLKEKGMPCPTVRMDHHWLPSWKGSDGKILPRAYFYDGPIPWDGRAPDGTQGGQNPEIPSIFMPHRGKHAASFLFKPPSLRGRVLLNLEFMCSHPTPLNGTSPPAWDFDTAGKLEISLWGRDGIGGNIPVLLPMPTQFALEDPLPGSPNPVYNGVTPVRDSGIYKLVDHDGGLPHFLNQSGLQPENMKMVDFSKFLVMRIERDLQAKQNSATFVHAIRITHIALSEYQAAVDGAGVGGQGEVLATKQLDILTFDGLEGRQDCCGPFGPSIPATEEEEPCV